MNSAQPRRRAQKLIQHDAGKNRQPDVIIVEKGAEAFFGDAFANQLRFVYSDFANKQSK